MGRVSYNLPLHRYTIRELKQMCKDSVISRCEMNDEFDRRGLLAADVIPYGRRSADRQFPEGNNDKTEVLDANTSTDSW